MALQTKDFSVTGKSSGGGITYTYTLRVTENSVSTLNNTSNLTVQAILKQTYSGTAFHTWYTGVSCRLAGSQVFSDYVQRSLSGTQEHIYYSWTGDVAHNADGTMALSVGGDFWQSTYESYSPPAMTVSGTMTLTTIPRASAVAAADADIGGVSEITISRASTAFQHSLHYSFGALEGYITPDGTISQSEVIFPATTVQWTVPTEFYYQIPDKIRADCTLTCRTYSGSTLVGSPRTAAFSARAAMVNCSPDLTVSAEDVNEETLALTGDPFKIIRYHSTIRCVADARAKYGASITVNQVNGKNITNGVRETAKAEVSTFEFYAEDSRGWAALETVKVPMVLYTHLTCNATARRTSPTDDTVLLQVTGSFHQEHFGNLENTLTLTYRINSRTAVEVPATVASDGSFSASVRIPGFDHTTSYTLTVVAQDLLERVSVKLPIQKGLPLFNWDADSFAFHVPVSCDGSIAGAYIRNVRVHGASCFRLKTRFDAWDQTGSRQSALLFGNCNGRTVLGIIMIHGNGVALWDGTDGVSITVEDAGVLGVDLGATAYDRFLLVSPEFISIV